jgi:hypothetical protein
MTIVSGYATAERLIAGDKKTCFRGNDRQKEENAMSATISRDELKAKLDRGDKFWLAETLPWEKVPKRPSPRRGQLAARSDQTGGTAGSTG